jgi:hypothetical protein
MNEAPFRSLGQAQIVAESDGWSAFIPGLPISADGGTRDQAIAELIDALREYAVDWREWLRDAPNHRRHQGLVQLIEMSDDERLRDLLVGDGA